MNTITFKNEKLFNIKPFPSGSGCSFGISINSKQKDGTYSKGKFVNCAYFNGVLEQGNYDLVGYLVDSEYNGNVEFKIMIKEATQSGYAPQKPQQKPMPKAMPQIDINTDEIPF